MLAETYVRAEGAFPLIGVGGIDSGRDRDRQDQGRRQPGAALHRAGVSRHRPAAARSRPISPRALKRGHREHSLDVDGRQSTARRSMTRGDSWPGLTDWRPRYSSARRVDQPQISQIGTRSRAEQEIAPQPAHRVEAHVPQVNAAGAAGCATMFERVEAERRQDHADQDRSRISRPSTASGEPPNRPSCSSSVVAMLATLRSWPVKRHCHSARPRGPDRLRSCSERVVPDRSAAATIQVALSARVTGRSRSSPASSPASPAGRLRAGGLSQRSRLMRGKRMATPDLCRVERCRPSNATSSTRPWSVSCDDLAHRAEAVDGVAAHEAVDLHQLLVGEAEIGLADRHQLVAVSPSSRRRTCSRNNTTSACRGRAAHTSARRRR